MQSVHVENGAHLSGLVAQVEIVGASMTSLTGRQERISVVNQEASA
jgi:hypothetical protein